MKRFKDIGIFYKLLSIYAAVIMALSSVVVLLIINAAQREMYEYLENNGKIIGESLASTAVLPILAKDDGLMTNYINGVLEIESVVSASVYLSDRTLFVKASKDEVHDDTEIMDKQTVTEKAFITEDGRILETYTPIYAEERGGYREEIGLAEDIVTSGIGDKSLIGHVNIGLSTKEFKRRIAARTTTVVAVSVLLFLISLAVFVPVLRRFVGPVVALSNEAKKVAEGDLDVKVTVNSNDEVGTMAGAFNYMVENLKLNISEVQRRADEIENLLEGAMEGIFLLDEDCSIIMVNKEMTRALCYEKDKLLGKELYAISNIEHSETCKDMQEADKATMKEVLFVRKDGRSIPFEVNFMPVDYEGRRGVLGFARDISERKEMEKQLVQSEKLAATGRLAADIAHEVNNPLGIIKNYLELLRKRAKGDGNRISEGIDIIDNEIDRIAQIIRGLLSFSRPDKDDVNLTDINKIITEFMVFTINTLERSGINAEVQLDSSLPEIEVSPNHIKQVLINLVNNAEDSMPDGGRLIIKTAVGEKGVEIIVEDSGTGIDEENLSEVFTPFYTTKGVKGTGLGLSITYGLIKNYGGNIEFKNKEEGGLIVTILLPC